MSRTSGIDRPRLRAVQTSPTVPDWPAERARSWSRATAPRFLPFVVLVSEVSGGVARVDGEGNAPCSPQDPSLCGPQLGFSLAFVLLVGSVVLQWARPLFACALGVAFCAYEVGYDNPLAAKAFSVSLFVCLAVGAWVTVCRQRQRNLAGEAGAGVSFTPVAPPAAHGRWGWSDLGALFPLDASALRALVAFQPARVVVSLLLVLASGGCGLVYHGAVVAEDAHLSRSVRVDARVADGPDDAQTFTPVVDVPGAARAAELIPLEWYPEGSTQPILLDPRDDDWARLVAEPDDQTGWLVAAGCTLLLALVLASSELSVRRSRTQLSTGAHAGLTVRIVRVPDGEVLVLASDRDLVVATFRSSPVDLRDHDGRLEDAPQVVAAVLFGDLRQGGWVAAQSAGELVLPESPLRPERHPIRYSEQLFNDPDEEFDVDPDTVGEEVLRRVVPAADSLPITAVNPTWLRAVGAVLTVGVVVVGPYAAWNWTEGLGELWGCLVLGGTALGRTVTWFSSGLTITRTAVVTDSGFFRRVMPLSLVDAVRVDGDTIYLVSTDEAISFEPCPDVTPTSARQERVREIAAQLRSLVDRAAGQHRRGGRRIGVGGVAAVIFVLGVVGPRALSHLG